MRLSVILPFYDETAFLRTALLSVAAQGIPDVEIIVVNDNPGRFTDADLQPLLLSGVRVVHHDVNRGLSAARNTGMAAATGELIAFLDSDDYYLSRGLARQYARAVETKADITHANCARTNPGRPELWMLGRDRTMFAEPAEGEGITGYAPGQFFVSSWSSIYRADFLRDKALSFDVEQVKFEDRLFVVQSVFAARRIATLGGTPVRAWRMRGGSISVTKPDLRIHALQVALIEKCVASVRAATLRDSLPPVFAAREMFNTVSRVLWDMTLLEDAVGNPDPEFAALLDRIRVLVSGESLAATLDDEVIAPINRIDTDSRWGRISRSDFLRFHAALQAGDMAGALALLQERRGDVVLPAPFVATGAGPDLTLHVGLHKTGTTYVQRQLLANRDRLARQGVLVPLAGLDDRSAAEQARTGGFAGHLGMARHVRDGSAPVWSDLKAEIAQSGAGRVVISCENLTFPQNADRGQRIASLADRLREVGFGRVSLVASVRRPDAWVEALWRENVVQARRDAGQSVTAFVIDHGATLKALPLLLGPLEAATGAICRLFDFDSARGRLWPAMAAAMDLPGDLREDDSAPRYATPRAAAMQALQNIALMTPDEAMRKQAFFALLSAAERLDLPPDTPFMTAPQRVALVNDWLAASAEWATERGLTIDSDAWRALAAAPTVPAPDAMPMDLIEAMATAVVMAEPVGGRLGAPTRPLGEMPLSGWFVDRAREVLPWNLRRKLRPFARRILLRQQPPE
jgi:hypothetical protein